MMLRKKRRKYLYFDKLLFLKDSVECEKTSSSLKQNKIVFNESGSEDNEAEPSANNIDSVPRPKSISKQKS